MASRLIMLRYHLKMSLRQLAQIPPHSSKQSTSPSNQLASQWQHVHQLLFLLHQIDTELDRATMENDTLRTWMNSLNGRVYRSSLMHLN